MTSKPRRRTTQQPRPAGQQAEPVPVALPEAPADAEPAPVTQRAVQLAGDGRPKCRVPGCILPEFIDGIGVCGGHYATHRGYANKLRS